jgi:hypothetical protein
VGLSKPTPRCNVSVHPAGKRKHCVVRLRKPSKEQKARPSMMPSALAVFGLMAGPMRSGLMPLLGQKLKSSNRAYVFRFAPKNGHRRSVRLTAPTCPIPRPCCSSPSSRSWSRWR